MTEILNMASFIDEMKFEIINGLKDCNGAVPVAAFILVGEDKFSAKYVSLKKKACVAVGIKPVEIHFPNEVTQEELLQEIEKLNNDPGINGILVQMPLPDHIDEFTVKNSIKYEKDVDGLTVRNIYNSIYDRGGSIPCVPATVLYILKKLKVKINKSSILICGKSDITSRPLLNVFSNLCADVFFADYDSESLEKFVRAADIVVSCSNKAGIIDSAWIKEGAAVFDAGNSAVPDKTKKSGYRIKGDINFDPEKCKGAFITPVPGGIGPASIAMLTLNIYKAFCNQKNLNKN